MTATMQLKDRTVTRYATANMFGDVTWHRGLGGDCGAGDARDVTLVIDLAGPLTLFIKWLIWDAGGLAVSLDGLRKEAPDLFAGASLQDAGPVPVHVSPMNGRSRIIATIHH